MSLSFIDHIAVESNDISKSVEWYSQKFDCEIKHQDDTWALLGFDNISLALVTPGEHPPHIAIHDDKIIGSNDIPDELAKNLYFLTHNTNIRFRKSI